MKWTETITPKQAVEELGVPYHGWMREMDRAWVSEDGQYSVMSRLLRTPFGKVEHVAITSAAGCGKCDGSGDIPWAVKMQIKKRIVWRKTRRHRGIPAAGQAGGCRRYLSPVGVRKRV